VNEVIGTLWRAYSSKILDPIQADRIQRQETRRAFYAGASALFTTIMGNMTEGDEPQEADVQMLNNIWRELNAFSDAVGSGRA
jgi:biotin synthase-like enzyme